MYLAFRLILCVLLAYPLSGICLETTHNEKPKTSTFVVDGETITIHNWNKRKHFHPKKIIRDLVDLRQAFVSFMNIDGHTNQLPIRSDLTIEIFRNEAQWQNHVEKNKYSEILKFRRGAYISEDQTIYTFYDARPQSSGTAHEGVLHEYVHHLFHLLYHTPYNKMQNEFIRSYVSPDWITEGIAQYFMALVSHDGGLATSDIDFLINKKNRNLPWATLSHIPAMRQNSNTDFYYYGAALIYFLIDHGYQEELVTMLERVYKPSYNYTDSVRNLILALYQEFGSQTEANKAFHTFIQTMIQK